MSGEWVRTYDNGTDYLESLGGVMWADAPEPLPWHKCQPQTRGWFGLHYAERCACGAYREHQRLSWLSKNERRNDRRKRRKEARMPREQVTCRECGEQYEAVKGSVSVRERLCTRCWGEWFVATGGQR